MANKWYRILDMDLKKLSNDDYEFFCTIHTKDDTKAFCVARSLITGNNNVDYAFVLPRNHKKYKTEKLETSLLTSKLDLFMRRAIKDGAV